MAEVTVKQRINKFDNLKGLAIFLIVLGHLTLYRKVDSMAFIRGIVFLFHLPVFFFVAGYFSKIGPDEPVKAFKRLFIPYVLFCIIWEIFKVYYLGGHPTSILFIHPGYMLWFLMSLFFMKLAPPIMDRFKYPLIISIIGALLIGFIDCNILGISRTFIYMPIFLLGFYYKDYKQRLTERFALIENNKFAIAVAILSILASAIIALTIPFDAIIMKHSYSDAFVIDILVRGLLILISTLNVLVLTRFMTNEKIVLTQFGVNSLTVYLFHPYAIKICKGLAKPYLKGHHKLLVVFVFVMAFIIVFVLSRDIVTKALNGLLNLIYKVLCIE